MGTHRAYRERRYEFGQQVLILRTRVALTQSALAEQIGVHRRSMQNWETGESYPKGETLQRLIAVLLRYHAFTEGNERAEAQALWSQADQDGPQPLATFDAVWFAGLLSLEGSGFRAQGSGSGDQEPGVRSQESEVNLTRSPAQGEHEVRPYSSPARPFIDWGEATAVPTLYGRDGELATLHHWIVDDRCRVITIVGLGGLGKSSLALTIAQRVLPLFDLVLFRSLQNGPPLAEVLDQIIRAVAHQPAPSPAALPDKITRLVQLLRERRCLLILDNLEAIMQPGAHPRQRPDRAAVQPDHDLLRDTNPAGGFTALERTDSTASTGVYTVTTTNALSDTQTVSAIGQTAFNRSERLSTAPNGATTRQHEWLTGFFEGGQGRQSVSVDTRGITITADQIPDPR